LKQYCHSAPQIDAGRDHAIDGRLNLYIVEKLLKLPMDYFERTPTGPHAWQDRSVWRIRHFLTGQLFGAFLDAVPLIGTDSGDADSRMALALMAFALAGIIFVIVMVFMKPIGRLYSPGPYASRPRARIWSRRFMASGPSSRWRWKGGGAGVGSARRRCDRCRSTPWGSWRTIRRRCRCRSSA
jgi:hypothetical protein